MAKFQINGPNGEHYEVEAPDDASEQQIMQYVQSEGPKQPKVGQAAAAVTGAGQGATFGFMDELQGAGLAAAAKLSGSDQSFSDLYDQGVAIPRAVQNAAAEQHPYTYYGSQIAAGAAPAIATGGAGIAPQAARASLATRSLAAAGEGAGYGAAFGAGTAEGGIKERAIGAGVGAAAGAAGGAVLPGAVDLVAGTARAVTAPLRGVLQPTKFGQQKVAEAMLRDKNPGEVADRSIEGVTGQLRTLRAETGKDLRLADLGGENTRNQLRAAANQASTGGQRLKNTLDGPTRQGGQWRRIERDMARGIGSPDDYAASVDQLVAERSANAADDFTKAYDAPWNVKADDPLVSLLQRGYMARVLEKTAESVEGTTGTSAAQMRPWELLHRVRMQIDREIKGLKSGTPDSKANWDANDLLQLKREFDDAIGRSNPKFKEATNRYSGDSALKGAAQDGFDEALALPTEDLARKMRSFKNESERDMYRMGASRALAGKIRKGNITSDRTENVFSSPDIMMRLKAIFPDNKSMREFQRDLVLEAKMADTRKAVQGNSTTAKQLTQGREAGQPVAAVGAAANAMMGRMEPLLNVLGRSYNSFTGLTPRTANAMIEAAMSKGGDDAVGSAMQNAMIAAENVPVGRAAAARQLNAGGNAAMPMLGYSQQNRR